MNDLDRAGQILDRLRTTLEVELVQARGQRVMVRTLDTQGLFERARQRGAFNVQLAQLERSLAEALEAAGHALGLKQVTLVDLRLAVPEAAQRLDGLLDEVRSLAGALRETDALNQRLGDRALRRLRGHLSAVTPRTVAYDRRGALSPIAALSTARRVA